MADYRITQKKSASLTYKDDWTGRLSAAYPGQNVTITGVVPTATGGATATLLSSTTTSITFRLATSGVSGAVPGDIVVTLTATLSNGDTDPRDLVVGVTT